MDKFLLKVCSKDTKRKSLKVDKDIDQAMKEEFHEFLRGYTDIFIKNVNNTKDHTYNDLK